MFLFVEAKNEGASLCGQESFEEIPYFRLSTFTTCFMFFNIFLKCWVWLNGKYIVNVNGCTDLGTCRLFATLSPVTIRSEVTKSVVLSFKEFRKRVLAYPYEIKLMSVLRVHRCNCIKKLSDQMYGCSWQCVYCKMLRASATGYLPFGEPSKPQIFGIYIYI